jgi:riboflavin biosynthesis pyrimidine reductase
MKDAATMAFHIVLCFSLSHACLGSTTASYASADGLAPTRSINNKILDVPGVEEESNDITDAAKIKHILDRVSSWMKEKRKNDSKRINLRQEYNFNHDTARRQYHRPFVTLAYAQSLDGMIATQITNHGDKDDEGTMHKSNNLQLSCPTSMELTHNLRNMHDTILVGGTTFLLDQPRLNARLLASKSSTSSSSTTTKLSPNNENVQQQQQPMPVVLDTNLHNLQQLLFNRTISHTDLHSSVHQPSKDGKMTTLLLPDIILSRIKAKNPTICCSSQAAKSFLDILEFIVQDQDEYNNSNKKRRREKTYSITVYKTMEEEYDTPYQEVAAVHASEKSTNIISSSSINNNNNNNNNYLPIKITIRIETHHHRNSKIVNDDVDLSNELTFTLLPCQTITKITHYADTNDNNYDDDDDDDDDDDNCNDVDDNTTMMKTKKKKNSQTLNLRHVLHQLYTQFDIESILVEGGAAILSSFVNECCMSGGGVSNDDSSFNSTSTWSKDTLVVDCICVTIAPTIIGGKWGLPVLGGLAAVAGRNSNLDSKLITIKNGEFVTLGQDCTFLGRIRLK